MNTEYSVKPEQGSSRIGVMDVLRGFALIGICIMNIEWFGRSFSELGHMDYRLEGADWAAAWLGRLFVEGKFYKIFALLFGMGFALMLINAQKHGRPFGLMFTRRLIGLFIIGLCHMVFLWGGDVLHDYAGAGILLLAWMGLLSFSWMQWAVPTQRFLYIGLATLFLPFMFGSYNAITQGTSQVDEALKADYHLSVAVSDQVTKIADDPAQTTVLQQIAQDELSGQLSIGAVNLSALSMQQKLIHLAERKYIEQHKVSLNKKREFDALSSSNYWHGVQYRVGEILNEMKRTPKFALILCFPLFLIGYWFVASGAITKPHQHKIVFVLMTVIGLSVGLVSGIAGLIGLTHPVTQQAGLVKQVSQMVFSFSQIFLSAGYVGAVVLIYLSDFGRKWTAWLVPMGSMTMTNYVMQSAILAVIFYGYAGGMYGELLRANQLIVVFCIVAFQAIFSYVWFRYCYFGPLEWLWRSFTRWEWQQLRKGAVLKKSLTQDNAMSIS